VARADHVEIQEPTLIQPRNPKDQHAAEGSLPFQVLSRGIGTRPTSGPFPLRSSWH